MKTTEFNPSDATKIACVLDNSVVIFDVGESSSVESTKVTLSNGRAQIQIPGKSSKLTSGKWSLDHQGNQVSHKV